MGRPPKPSIDNSLGGTGDLLRDAYGIRMAIPHGPLQQAVIITLDLAQRKTIDESIEEANAHIARLLNEGWRLMWATPFSGSQTTTIALMVVIER
jgi:hypothetical protein